MLTSASRRELDSTKSQGEVLILPKGKHKKSNRQPAARGVSEKKAGSILQRYVTALTTASKVLTVA
jgi:hypothetical protein